MIVIHALLFDLSIILCVPTQFLCFVLKYMAFISLLLISDTQKTAKYG